ncbi:MAG: GH116 family glycosyl hydrolase [Bacteroidales bacterium]|jgi:glycogen debranching enzyme
MKKIAAIIITVAVTIFLSVTALSKPKIILGIIVPGSELRQTEFGAMSGMLNKTGTVSVREIPLQSLNGMEHCDVVWYHRPDTADITVNEINAGEKIKKYVSEGGALILSMDAVKLLNTWGIEPAEIETFSYEAIDDGFGRKIGFHSYRGHPIFDKLYGGAYPWHGKEDNVCRLNGYTEDNMPQAKGARVIATQWEYIYNRPEKKLIWETPYGKGSILAIGGCLYYGQDNFHTQILEQFTTNCLRYMNGEKNDNPETYRDYSPVTTESYSGKDEYSKVSFSRPVAGIPVQSENMLSRPAENHYFDLATKRTMIVGPEQAGIDEIWTHPFMSLRDYRVRIKIEGTDELVALADHKPLFEIHPHAIVRHYSIGDLTLTETITSAIDEPLTVIHYQWSGSQVSSIVTDFTSNLRYMWPYDETALGTVIYRWSQEMNAFIVSDKNKEFVSIAGANLPGRVLEAGQDVSTEQTGCACSVEYNTTDANALDIILSAGSTSERETVALYTKAAANPGQVAEDAAGYYKDYLDGVINITTPDSVFNQAFRWAVISSSQFITSTPGIGTSLMAGYSSSRRGWGGGHRVSGRPGYAWYFGRDAVWSGFAFNNMGDFETTRHILETLIAHQQVDGKIYHELTTSGFVHFDASDATPLFVTLMAHYLRSSGDVSFAKAHIRAIHKAMDYCYSTDTDGDGLIEISNVGHGWLEGGELFGSKTEFYLCGIWAQALRDASYISGLCGNTRKQIQYVKDVQRVTATLETFWNEKGYYNYGKRNDGTFTQPLLILTAVPAYFKTVDSIRAREMVKLYALPEMSADWGVRTIADTSGIDEEGAYGPRNVWPLFTGWASLAGYKHGLHTQAFAQLYNNLLNYKGFALGRIPEVINGDVYRNNGITLHQCWSETMAIMPLVEGMLGFEPDALHNSMILSPALPADWKTFKVERLMTGSITTGFSMHKEQGKITYSFVSSNPTDIAFAPVFPPKTDIMEVTVNGKPVKYTISDEEESLILHVTVKNKGNCTVEITCRESPCALASVVVPRTDQLSGGFRVLSQTFADHMLEVEVSGRPGSEHILELYLPYGYERIEGAGEPVGLRNSVTGVKVQFGPSAERYVKKTVRIAVPRK